MAPTPTAIPATPNQTKHNPDTELVLRFVAGKDVPCPICDYSLRDLAEPRCPECGCAIELRVNSPNLRTGPWALAIVSFALALGFDGVVSLMFCTILIMNPTQQWQPFGIVTLFVLMAGAMLTGILTLVRKRSKWARLPLPRQWASAVTIFVVVGLFHAMVGAAFILITRTMGAARSAPAATSPAPSAGPVED